jgi:hypothetical protein
VLLSWSVFTFLLVAAIGVDQYFTRKKKKVIAGE